MKQTDGGMGRGSTGVTGRFQSSVVKTTEAKEDGGKRTGTLQENRRIREVRSGCSDKITSL